MFTCAHPVMSLHDFDSAQEEGIIVKNLTSPWRLGTRGKEWIKIKPDYIENVSFSGWQTHSSDFCSTWVRQVSCAGKAILLS